MMKNINNLPPCPICGGEMRMGISMSGPKIYCKDYHKCGGILNPNKLLPEEYILKFVDPFVTIQPESKEDFKKVMGWDDKTFMSKVFVRLKQCDI